MSCKFLNINQYAVVWLLLLGLTATWLTWGQTGHTEDNPGSQSELSVSGTVDSEQGEHTDPFALILLELALIILFAAVGRWAAARMDQPGVLGELLAGVLIGNVGYWLHFPLFLIVMNSADVSSVWELVWHGGASVADAAQSVFSAEEMTEGGIGWRIVGLLTGPGGGYLLDMWKALWIFSNLGVILLLFMVGLESSVHEMRRVGSSAMLVAVVGVVLPMLFGYGTSLFFLPDEPESVHLFIGATLTATSVGITARVFKDLKKLQTSEAKVILGAAVIDDVLGLIVLAIVVGIVATGELHYGEVMRIVALSAAFLGLLMLFGERMMKRLVPVAVKLDRLNARVLFPLGLAFVMAWIASMIELATIVGAFAAGLILSEEHFAEHYKNQAMRMEDVIGPLESIFAPIFFVLMGMQVNMETFLDERTIWFALTLTVVAIIGKILAGVVSGKNKDKLSVGIGMIPRGEVGLIFASVGKGLGVVSDAVFSAVVFTVIVTTLSTPFGLRWSLFRGSREKVS